MTLLAGPSGSKPYLNAAAYMLASTFLFAIMVASIRHVGDLGVDSFEIIFFRNLFGFLVIGPILVREGTSLLRTDRLWFFGLRSALGLVSMFMWFYAVTVTPLAEAVSLSFTTPLFVTVLAIGFLAERGGAHRWLATVVGFGGALLIIRPGFAELTSGHLFLLVSSVFNAGSMILIKMLARTEPAERIVAYMTIIFTPISLIPALFVWQWPTLAQLAWLVVVGTSGTLAHIMMTRAFGRADAAALMPLDFARLLFAGVIGFFAFAERPDLWTVIGGVVIFVSSVYLARNESKARSPLSRDSAGPV